MGSKNMGIKIRWTINSGYKLKGQLKGFLEMRSLRNLERNGNTLRRDSKAKERNT